VKGEGQLANESTKGATNRIIEKELEQARERLLDLTMRNRLLNFRPTKRSTILVVDEVPREVYGRIVIDDNKKMEFRPKREAVGPLSNVRRPATETNPDEEVDPYADLWDIDESELKGVHTDRYLQTDLPLLELQRRLFHIRHKAETIMEEQGYTVLFLALGFLEWTESAKADVMRKGPLILVPVEMERTAVGKAYKVSWTGEDIYTNVSLQAKLHEQGVKLPDFEMPQDKSGIDLYADEVRKAIAVIKGWRVTSDIYLGFFNFTKFVMYRDLDPRSWPEQRSPAKHPLIRAVFAPETEKESECDGEPADVDEQEVAQLEIRNLYHVKDADSSQVAVIEMAKTGHNLVVEGPPGTGKSQTIVNLIAELLAMGKTVLFVSQKMAALEVVKERLDKCGLTDASLQLHSRYVNKRMFLRELERTVNAPQPTEVPLRIEFRQHEHLTAYLNGYVLALKEPLNQLGLAPYDLYELREKARKHFSDRGGDWARVNLSDPEKWTEEEYQEAKRTLDGLSVVWPHTPVAKHPWRACEPQRILPNDVREIRELINKLRDELEELQRLLGKLDEVSAVGKPQHLRNARLAIAAARVMSAARPAERSVLLNDEWNQPSVTAQQLLDEVATLQNQLRTLQVLFLPEAFSLDIAGLKERLADAERRWYKFVLLRYWRFRKEAATLYQVRARKSTKQVLTDLDRLAEFLELRRQLAINEEKGRGLFGHSWKGEGSDVVLLRKFAHWITDFRRQVIEGYLTERAIDLAETGVDRQQVIEVTQQLEQHLNLVIEVRDSLARRLSLDYDLAFATPPDEAPFAQWLAILETWADATEELQRWSDWVRLKRELAATVAKPLVSLAEQGLVAPRDLVPTFEGNLAEALLAVAFEQRPALEDFITELHEKKISSFIELDEHIIRLNRQRIAHDLWKARPEIVGGAPRHSEAGILLGELNRKRGHMPIRKLMKNIGHLIQRIKPCFMMSPLSIAQFLAPSVSSFDVIIFDEASQVRPEDAIGALLRGNQLIVMGDTHQLPPTSFFDRMATEDDYEKEYEHATSATEMESILHQCRRSFPNKTLRWHYRSRHESLIAVSNQEFYKNSLLVYPSSADRAPNLGLEFVHLPDAVYDRGQSSTNREEARAVVQAAFDHYRQFPEKSLGVGAFGIKQQQAIHEELEAQFRQHPDMQNYFSRKRDEHFFVKNLETIQGDERDVIFISMGYGVDSNGKLSHNFGPLNKEGGERRLNVLITRARERCVVFSNFRAQDLAVDEKSAFGLRALKTFLDYAENRNLHSIVETGADTDSPFEDAVYDFLRDHGYEVRKQVGCAGFRIDLAVVDPDTPGRYLLAVECDGAPYHSSLVARDRDRLRQRVLENLGWRIHRVWSTGWYRNRAEAEKRLLEAVEAAKHNRHDLVMPPTGDLDRARDDSPDGIQREYDSGQYARIPSLEAQVPEYTKCEDLGIQMYGELHQYPPRLMAKAIKRIAETEGPVHIDEAVNRIRVAWGLRRAGSRIRDAVRWGIEHAERVKFIEVKGAFIWFAEQTLTPLRHRTGDPPAKIDYICDEEIAEAIRMVLKTHFATDRTELATQAARLLGFQAVHSSTSERVQFVIEHLMESGELRLLANGMVDLVT